MPVSNTRRLFTRFAVAVNYAVAQPSMFFMAILTILLWLGSGPLFKWDDTWQLFINTTTTIITFLMVFLIHHAQHVHWEDSLPLIHEVEEHLSSASRFQVEYIHKSPHGSSARTRLSTSVTQLAHAQARSETAVLTYLRRRHPGHDITILTLEYQDASGHAL